MEHPRILPECHADTLMADMLIAHFTNAPVRPYTAHNRGINMVFETLKEFAPKKRKAIGIIDDDKRKDKDPYYKEYILKEETACFKYLVHPNGYHHLIVTYGKGFEVFIQRVAEEKEVKHKFLDDMERLKISSKSETARTDNDLKNLLNTLIQKRSPSLIRIMEIITQFMH